MLEIFSPTLEKEKEEMIQRLRESFCAIFEDLQIDHPDAVDALFGDLTNMYSEPHRAYHTLEHIQNILKLLEQQKTNAKDYSALRLAAWFHDAVYQTSQQSNEEKSAEMALEQLTLLGVKEETIRHTVQLIIATKTHTPIQGNPDSFVFLDADLSILGAPADEYDNYAKNIRKEYSWVPEEQYRKGRKAILEKFLLRDRLFLTEEAYKTLETQARENLTREIESLS